MKLLFTIFLSLPALALAQGSLAPPGAPAPSMRSLGQIEPRQPLQAGVDGVTIGGNGGFIITAPGSYYLTANLTLASGDGIVIYAGNVTVDLNGFTIASTASPATGYGIQCASNDGNIAIRNGTIHSTTTYDGAFTLGGFAGGVFNSAITAHLSVTDLNVSGISQYGIYLGGTATSVRNCRVSVCGGRGIVATEISDSVALTCGGDGIAGNNVLNCSGESKASEFGYGNGVTAVTATNCRGVSIGGIGLSAGTATNCTGQSTSAPGVLANLATNCRGTSTTDAGLSAQNATNCYGQCAEGHGLDVTFCALNSSGDSTNSTGLQARKAENCRGTSTTGIGLLAEDMATGCVGSTTSGVYALYTGIATNCQASNSEGQRYAFGLRASSAFNSSGHTKTGMAGLYAADRATHCVGSTELGTYGLESQGTATDCTGTVNASANTDPGSVGLFASRATGCTGTNNSTAAGSYGIMCYKTVHRSYGTGIVGIWANGSANFCHARSTASSAPVAIEANVVIGCTADIGTISGTHYITP